MFNKKRLAFLSQACAFTLSIAAFSIPAACAQVPGIPTPGTTPDQSQAGVLRGQVRTDSVPAQKLLTEGKYAQAEANFRDLLVNNPADLAATVGLGMALAYQFKLDGANQLFDKVLTQDPNNAEAYAGKATVLLNRLQSSNGLVRSERDSILSQAKQYSDQACRLAPANADAQYTLGQVYKEQGKVDDAASAYRNAIQFEPRLSFGYSALGSIELAKNSLAAAAADFQKAIEINSSNSTAHYGLGATYLKQGKTDDAVTELNTSLYQYPNSWPVRMALGQAYQTQGNTAAALQQYQLSTLIKPENAEPYLHMAEIRQERGDLELAIADLRSGLTQDPQNVDLREKIADITLQLDKADDAIKQYKIVLQMSPSYTPALKGLTQALYLKSQKAAAGAVLQTNDYDTAFKAIDEAIKINPNDMELLLGKAKLMSLSGQKPDLSQMHTPTNEAETVAFAAALRMAGDFTKGSTMLAGVVNAQTDPKQSYALGDMAVMMRDLPNAEAAYKKGQSLSGSPDRGQRGLTQISQLRKTAQDELVVADELTKKKQMDGAIMKYRECLASNPALADARLGLARALEKGSKGQPSMLDEAVQQYQYYLVFKTDLPQQERQKISDDCQKLAEKAYKLNEKAGKNKAL